MSNSIKKERFSLSNLTQHFCLEFARKIFIVTNTHKQACGKAVRS